jgi:hypothetical protein
MQQAVKALLSEPLGRLVRRGVVHGGDRVEITHKEGDTKLTFSVSADPITAAIEAAKPIGEEPVAVKTDLPAGEVKADGAGADGAAVDSKVGQAGGGTQVKVPDNGPLPGQSTVVQDFFIVLQAADNQHAALKEAMYAFLASSPMIKISEDQNKYGDPTVVSGIVVTVNTTLVKVMAPIEAMFALKRSMPFLDINILPGKIEL